MGQAVLEAVSEELIKLSRNGEQIIAKKRTLNVSFVNCAEDHLAFWYLRDVKRDRAWDDCAFLFNII
ncbi:hypothetical protein [Cohnella sp. AR92]|uniref:hypothetical protein n=1 Tax=Cohnella sp. AR92 TaxID=648716 RepID=UPI000F8E4A1A|nr:hypothetical protein [Cohnella sp. AR92]RUS49120.1 hypothetical protein ELR57_01920 [Cohnella sp. AR92]